MAPSREVRTASGSAGAVGHAPRGLAQCASLFSGSDPTADPSAEFIPDISFQEVVARDLRVMDAAAVSLCRENDLPIIVLNLEDQGAVQAAIRGERIGTLVS